MRNLSILFICLFLASCQSDTSRAWQPLDLTGNNIPVTIMAPDSARVQTSNLSGIMQDVTIKSPADGYSVQILASQAATNDMARLKATQLELVRSNRYFEQIVTEDDQGFIFENRIDSLPLYGFRYILYRGDQEIVFQNGLEGTFDLPEIEAMYAAVKQEK